MGEYDGESPLPQSDPPGHPFNGLYSFLSRANWSSGTGLDGASSLCYIQSALSLDSDGSTLDEALSSVEMRHQWHPPHDPWFRTWSAPLCLIFHLVL